MAVDQQQIQEYQKAAKDLGDRDFLGSAFTGSLDDSLDANFLQENQNTPDEQAHDHDPGKEHRDELNRKTHNYAVKNGSEDGAYAGLLMKQVSKSGTSAGGGKSKKDRQSRKAIIDEMLRQLADINRQIQWYENEINQLTHDLARVENKLEQARDVLNESEALIELRDNGLFDPENNPHHAARLEALGVTVEEYIADPRILDRLAEAKRDEIGDLNQEATDIRAKIKSHVLKVDELKVESEEVSKELHELGASATIDQVQQVTAEKDELVVGQVAHDSNTSKKISEKLYEVRGRNEEEIDELSTLRMGDTGSNELIDPGNELGNLGGQGPLFLASDGGNERSTSSAKEVSEPPFMTRNLSEDFKRAHSGENSGPANTQDQTIVADLQISPDLNGV